MRTKLIITGSILFTLLIATPPAAHAQDCGSDCVPCATTTKEGRIYTEQGGYDMDCPTHGGNTCVECDFSIADAGPAAEQILQRVSSASALELIVVVEENRDRLLLHPSRRLLVVRQETSCNAKALGGLMTVSPERMAALEHLGIPSLEDFLRSEAP